MTIRAGIVGVSGYMGAELARLLQLHPAAEMTYVSSNTFEGKHIWEALPGFSRRSTLVCETYDQQAAANQCDVVFFAADGGFAAQNASWLLERGKVVIDLSADFRIKDVDAYRKWYKETPAEPCLMAKAVYGLPELNKDAIRSARLIANPGCYPTSAILALAPLVESGAIQLDSIVINSMSGVSGAGRSKHSLMYHFPELNGGAQPYAVAGTHRHTPEIEQALSEIAGEQITVSFTPHLFPVNRGILTTALATLHEQRSAAELRAKFTEFYKDAPFVVVLPDGQWPVTKNLLGSNAIHVGLAVDPRTHRVTVVSAEDNLVKGGSGQAVQNMNLVFGLEETLGLEGSSLFP